MAFNPLQETGVSLDKQTRNWTELNVAPYDNRDIDPYTRARVLTMNAVEIEGIFFSHQFARHCTTTEVRKYLAMTRQIEQQQQKAIAWLIPGEESNLELSIGYEQTAVELTAVLARREADPYVRSVFELGLLEDFDHLYRFANLLDQLEEKSARFLVQEYTEIMPGRPTLEQHRHPYDDLRRQTDFTRADGATPLHILTLVALKQQLMNFYMNVGNRPMNPLARALYLEIAQVEEEHLTQFESLLDPMTSWLQREVSHQYNECYLYYSFMVQESHPQIRTLWDLHLNMELNHLHHACELLRKLEKRAPEEFLPQDMPEPIAFELNREYIRRCLSEKVDATSEGEQEVSRVSLHPDSRYFRFQRVVNQGEVPSEAVLSEHIESRGREYRSQIDGEHPVLRLREMTEEAQREFQTDFQEEIASATGEVTVPESRKTG